MARNKKIRTARAKKPRRKSTATRPKKNPVESLTGQGRLQLVLWDVYEKPRLFKKLMECRTDRAKLRDATASYLLSDKEIDILSARLNQETVNVDIRKVMAALHEYTFPKIPREVIIRRLKRLQKPWAPWVPDLEVEQGPETPNVPGPQG